MSTPNASVALREALVGLLSNIRIHREGECPGLIPADCLDAIYESAEIARHALDATADTSPSSCQALEATYDLARWWLKENAVEIQFDPTNEHVVTKLVALLKSARGMP